ncbi:hypothetical protein NMG60_11005015 [Bertholletia excelsa]
MAAIGWQWRILDSSKVILFSALALAAVLVSADRRLKQDFSSDGSEANPEVESERLMKVVHVLGLNRQLLYERIWPEMEFGWRIIVGTIIGFFGAAFGSIGGVGGGGIFVPMLTLIIGFDAKSSTALSKCMIAGAAAATVLCNIKQRHPTLDLPLIDYDLVLLFQPMLVLGISIGVAFNLIFADWMVIVLLILLFLGSSTRAFFKGVETWKKETMIKKEVARFMASKGTDGEQVEYKPLPGGPNSGSERESRVSFTENVDWKALGIVVAVWLIILALQIAKNESVNCSVAYWIFNLLQIPVAVGVSAYEAVSLYKGQRTIASTGEAEKNWQVYQLVLYCCCGILAGIVGGLLGLGGGFILGPLLLELGIPPQVSSATVTFAMLFSSSMSVAQYYLLHRFPVPYGLYFVAVAIIAAFMGQHVVKRIIALLGRASLIIFILAFTIFISAISLGVVGFSMLRRIEEEYIGFNDICDYIP